jgi:hypothetical protein
MSGQVWVGRLFITMPVRAAQAARRPLARLRVEDPRQTVELASVFGCSSPRTF